MKTNKRTSVPSYKWRPQIYNQLKSGLLENIDLQNAWTPPNPFEDRNVKNYYSVPNNIPQETAGRFLKFCLYVEKMNFECEPG